EPTILCRPGRLLDALHNGVKHGFSGNRTDQGEAADDAAPAAKNDLLVEPQPPAWLVGKGRTNSKWGLAAIVAGVAVRAMEIYGAVSYLVSQSQPHYWVAGGADTAPPNE